MMTMMTNYDRHIRNAGNRRTWTDMVSDARRNWHKRQSLGAGIFVFLFAPVSFWATYPLPYEVRDE